MNNTQKQPAIVMDQQALATVVDHTYHLQVEVVGLHFQILVLHSVNITYDDDCFYYFEQ